MTEALVAGIVVFVLAMMIGIEVIKKVPTILHTPLMSGSNAISGITIVGAILVASQAGVLNTWLGFVDYGLPAGDPVPPLPETLLAVL